MQFVIGKGSECAKGDVCLLLENRAERESSDMYPADVLILVGIGSNRGDSIGIVLESVERLRVFARGAVRSSSLWRTSPVDCPPDSGDFVNAVAAFEPRSGLTPEILLAGLKQMECEFGREATPVRNAPRELDLDLLIYGDETRVTPQFVLPHPRATERRFVMAPAAEVAAEFRWPGTEATVAELLARIEDEGTVERLAVGARTSSASASSA